jgi:hypothetical protein
MGTLQDRMSSNTGPAVQRHAGVSRNLIWGLNGEREIKRFEVQDLAGHKEDQVVTANALRPLFALRAWMKFKAFSAGC